MCLSIAYITFEYYDFYSLYIESVTAFIVYFSHSHERPQHRKKYMAVDFDQILIFEFIQIIIIICRSDSFFFFLLNSWVIQNRIHLSRGSDWSLSTILSSWSNLFIYCCLFINIDSDVFFKSKFICKTVANCLFIN